MEALLHQLVLGGSQVATTVRETPAFADRGFDATTITDIAQPRGLAAHRHPYFLSKRYASTTSPKPTTTPTEADRHT
ncbi:hypothetical protein ABZ565_34550 [Streptomyces sp. NPDC016469]|uniref:hypothetical protein n=1 Tax=Streptomyces sp. NPDC016469 TaxID=3157191 RepID=UPI0033ED6FE5